MKGQTTLQRQLTIQKPPTNSILPQPSAIDRMESHIMPNKTQIASLIAGMGSGILASVVCAPLDLVKTRMQVYGTMHIKEKSLTNTIIEIVQKDGLLGCFRGLAPTLATVPLFWGLYFPLYESAKHELMNNYCSNTSIDNKNSNPKEPVWIHVTAAISAGAAADIICNPMFLVRTRMQTESLHRVYENNPGKQLTMRSTIIQLYREGGIPIFWRGLTASMMGLSHVGIQFPVYEYCKEQARLRNVDNVEKPLDLLFSSGISKITACVFTYPHEVVRSRMMDLRGRHGRGIVATAKLIVKEEGTAGLYKGLHVSLIRVLPNCCLTFLSYELILRWVKLNLLFVDDGHK